MSRPSNSTSGCGRRRWSEGIGFHGRSMLYIMVNEDRPDGQAIRDATREAHLAYLERHKSIVVLAGGTLAEDGKTRTGSVFKTAKITRMRRGQWSPQAAPKSAEGN